MEGRRGTVAAVGGGLAVLTVLLVLFLLPERATPPIERALYDRVQLGMTEAELLTAIGHSPGDHSQAAHYGTGLVAEEGLPIRVITWAEQPDGRLSYVD